MADFADALGRDGGRGVHAVVDARAADDRLIGVITTNIEPSMPQTVRLGWWIGPGDRGKGHLRRAARLTVDDTLASGWSVVAECSPENMPSRRVVERLRFAHTGSRQLRLSDGRWVESWWFERHPDGDRPPQTTDPAAPTR